jgi:hypothetical protein
MASRTRNSAPPWDFLQDASVASLQSYELSRLNHAANLRRELAALLDQWIEETAHALLAQWEREGRAFLREPNPPKPELQPELPFTEAIETPHPISRSINALRRNVRVARE